MTRGLLGVLKLCAFVLVLPVLVAVLCAFYKELAVFKDGRDAFGWGVAAYTGFHLFFFAPHGFYRFWQGIFMEICAFAGTAANAIVLAVPVVPTVLLLVYYISTVVFRQPWGVGVLLFAAGLALAFHVVLSAQELYETDQSKLKGHYLFVLALIIISNLFITAGLMDLIFKHFSFVAFWKEGWKITARIYMDFARMIGRI